MPVDARLLRASAEEEKAERTKAEGKSGAASRARQPVEEQEETPKGRIRGRWLIEWGQLDGPFVLLTVWSPLGVRQTVPISGAVADGLIRELEAEEEIPYLSGKILEWLRDPELRGPILEHIRRSVGRVYSAAALRAAEEYVHSMELKERRYKALLNEKTE